MSGLPKGWANSPLEEIVTFNPRHPTDTEPFLEVSFVPMSGVSDRNWQLQLEEVRPFNKASKNFTHFSEGDVLFAKITPSMENGKAAIAQNLTNKMGCGTTELHVLRPSIGVESKYVYRFIHQESFRKEAARNMTGTAGQLRVPVAFLREVLIPLPPLPEQHRIVAKLEKLLHKVDACQERLEKIPAILKRFRQSILAAACSGRLTADWREKENLSFDWLDVVTSDLGKISGGITQNGKRKNLLHQLPYLRVANVYANELRLDDVALIGVNQSEIERTILQKGDLLFVEGNGSIEQIGRVALWNGSIYPCLHQNHLIKFRSYKNSIPNYILFWMMAPIGRESLMEAAVSTAGLHTLSISKIEKIPIKLPPLLEQQEIVRRVEALFAVADRIEARYKKAKTQVDRLTQSILAKAFRGELVPQDPNDEPASVLLERIRTERDRRAAEPKKNNKSASGKLKKKSTQFRKVTQ